MNAVYNLSIVKPIKTYFIYIQKHSKKLNYRIDILIIVYKSQIAHQLIVLRVNGLFIYMPYFNIYLVCVTFKNLF